jgi:hypothetical protein
LLDITTSTDNPMAPSQNRTNIALVLKCQTTRGKID